MLLRFAYILNDAVALAPNSTTRRRRLESGEDDCNDGATTSRAVRTMDGATTRIRDGDLSGKEAGKEQGARSNLSGKEEGSLGRHEVVERGRAQPFGWLICFFL